MKKRTGFKFVMWVSIICFISSGLVFSQFLTFKIPFYNVENSKNEKNIIKPDFYYQDQNRVLKKEPMEKISSTSPKIDVSGIWESSIGWKYDIKQKGNDFSWIVINRNQTAVGSIEKNNKDIQATWNDSGSKGTSKGSILEADEKGKATFIEWDNGVFFHRN